MQKLLLIILVVFISKEIKANESVPIFKIRIPKERTTGNSVLENMTRDSLVFLLTAFSNPETSETKIVSDPKLLTEDWLEFNREGIVLEAIEKFIEMEEASSYLEVFSILKTFLREGAYHRVQHLQHANTPLPPNVLSLEKEFHFKSWQKTIIENSKVKGKTRVLYRSNSKSFKMSVAQTEVDGAVRETEIIMKREDASGNYDFYVFDSHGEPATHSTFLNGNKKEVVGYAPHTCIACHYDGAHRKFQTKPLSFHP